MECLRSFSFRVLANTNLSGLDVKQWIIGTNQHFWSSSTAGTSTFNFQGFKNINIYGVDVTGAISSNKDNAVSGVIVNDWQIDVLLSGQSPLVGGTTTPVPNYYGIDVTSTTNRVFTLGKFSNSLKLASPIESVQFIQLQRTYADGTGWQTAGTTELSWKLNFIVYYKFEGE